MCTTLKFKSLSTVIKDNTLIISAVRSDNKIVSASTTFYSPLTDTKEILESIRALIKSLDKQKVLPKTPQINNQQNREIESNA